MKIKLTIIIFDFNNFKHYVKVTYIKDMEVYYVLERIINSYGGINNYLVGVGEIIISIHEPNVKKPALLKWEEGMHGACGISFGDMFKLPDCPGFQSFRNIFNDVQWTLAMELCDGTGRQLMADNHNMLYNTMKKRVERIYTLADIPGFCNLNNHDKAKRFIEFMIEKGAYIKVV
jgi:hypothetical protein